MMPHQIGITGGIGAGKSTICQIFATLGVPVYEADARAKWLIQYDNDLKNKIIDLLGTRAYEPNDTYDRAWVAAQVFNNQGLLQKLNAIVHPRVFEDTQAWVQKHADSVYVLKEAAIMNSRAGSGNALYKIIVVTAPIDLRVARIKTRDPQRSEQEIQEIISRQMTDAQRLDLADYVIVNDNRKPLIEQVLALDAIFKSH